MLVASPAGTANLRQRIDFYSVAGKSLVEILDLAPPRFVSAEDAHKQLNYINGYVRHPDLDCKAVVVEQHYIDRDHMEDHSVFYSVDPGTPPLPPT
jgi:hypothetical protein